MWIWSFGVNKMDMGEIPRWELCFFILMEVFFMGLNGPVLRDTDTGV